MQTGCADALKPREMLECISTPRYRLAHASTAKATYKPCTPVSAHIELVPTCRTHAHSVNHTAVRQTTSNQQVHMALLAHTCSAMWQLHTPADYLVVHMHDFRQWYAVRRTIEHGYTACAGSRHSCIVHATQCAASALLSNSAQRTPKATIRDPTPKVGLCMLALPLAKTYAGATLALCSQGDAQTAEKTALQLCYLHTTLPTTRYHAQVQPTQQTCRSVC